MVESMKRSFLVLPVVSLVLLVGCSGVDTATMDASGETPPAASSGTSSEAAAPSVDAPENVVTSSEPAATSSIPSPDADQQARLIAKLAAVSPVLVENPERMVTRARDTCQNVQSDGTDLATRNAQQRFTTTGLDTITTDQAQDIVAAVVDTFCPAS